MHKPKAAGKRGTAELCDLLAAALLLTACSGAEGEAAPCPESSAETATDPSAGLQELRALGYAQWDPGHDADSARGVTRTSPNSSPWPRVWADDRSTVRAMNAEGELLVELEVPGHAQVEFARVIPGGRFLCVSVDEGVTLLEPSGDVVFQTSLAAHHEAVVVPDGRARGSRRFAVLVHREVEHAGRLVRFDSVKILDEATGMPSGTDPAFDTWVARSQILAATGQQEHPLDRAAAAGSRDGRIYDYFHANGIAFSDAQTMVLCLRNVDAMVTVDLPSGEVRGAIGPGLLDWPHAPSFVEGPGGSSRLLAFDNGKHRGWSRVVELDPESGEILWQWDGSPHRTLWSELRGCAQRLPDGHTLITESERGRVLEIDRAGAVLWEFENPESPKDDSTSRRRIYRMLATPMLATETPGPGTSPEGSANWRPRR